MDGWLISFRAEQQQRDRKLMGGNGGDFKERGRKPTNLWPSHCHTTIFETPSGTSNVVTAFRYDASRNGRLRLRLRLRLWLEHSPGLTSANGNKQQISWMAVWKKKCLIGRHHCITNHRAFFVHTKNCHDHHWTLVNNHSDLFQALSKSTKLMRLAFFSFWHGMGTTAGYLSQLSLSCCCCCCFANSLPNFFVFGEKLRGWNFLELIQIPNPISPNRLVKPWSGMIFEPLVFPLGKGGRLTSQ